MTKRNRDLANRGTRPTGPVAPGRGGTVVHRVVPAHLACHVGARAQAGDRNPWAAVVSIALGTFALVFSELIPVGLLADISGHLRVSIGTGGLMVVVPAAAVAAAGSLALLGRAGASIGPLPTGSAYLPPPSQAAISGKENSAQPTR